MTVLLSPSMRPPDELEIWHPACMDLPCEASRTPASGTGLLKTSCHVAPRYSNFESYDADPSVFKHSTVQVLNGKFSLKVPVGAMITVTTIKTGQKGSFQGIPPSSPSFPLNYADDFQSSADSENARCLHCFKLRGPVLQIPCFARRCRQVVCRPDRFLRDPPSRGWHAQPQADGAQVQQMESRAGQGSSQPCRVSRVHSA